MEGNELSQTILEALKGSSKACTELNQFVFQAANHLRAGEIQEGNKLLGLILDDFSQLVDLLMDLRQVKDFSEEAGGEKITEMEIESLGMLQQLKMVLDAQENQDWVFLADLLEYEFADKLASWSSYFDKLSENT